MPSVQHGLPALLKGFLIGLLALGTTMLIYWSLGIPVVQIDHITRECVAVKPPAAGTCTNLPSRYVVEYVQHSTGHLTPFVVQ